MLQVMESETPAQSVKLNMASLLVNNESNEAEEDMDVLELGDSVPIPLPQSELSSVDCRRCGQMGHYAYTCENVKDKSVYWRNRVKDPVFNDREKERLKRRKAMYRQKKKLSKMLDKKLKIVGDFKGRSVTLDG